MSKKEEMFALVEQWRKSGLTRKSFANQHGLSSESFNYWCKKQYGEVEKLKTDQRIGVPGEALVAVPDFTEITSSLVKNTHGRPIRMELELSGGIHIKIY